MWEIHLNQNNVSCCVVIMCLILPDNGPASALTGRHYRGLAFPILFLLPLSSPPLSCSLHCGQIIIIIGFTYIFTSAEAAVGGRGEVQRQVQRWTKAATNATTKTGRPTPDLCLLKNRGALVWAGHSDFPARFHGGQPSAEQHPNTPGRRPLLSP